MALFKPAENTSAFLKMGMLGFMGSGKTYTASIVARDFVLHMQKLKIEYATKPVMFLDTETGSDWVRPVFEKASIKFDSAKTRSFANLLKAVPEAEANGSILIIDSVTHFWKELCESYQKSKKRTRLEFQDWAYLKGEWSKFTDLFVNSNLHIILNGRAGFEYDYIEDDQGKKNLEKTGVKMKAEGEMGYEPSLLVVMERHQKVEGGHVVETWREAEIIKDRSTLLDGAHFVNPTFKDFLPHIALLNLGGRQLGVDTTHTTQHAPEERRADWNSTQRKIVLAEIETLLVEFHPSTGKEDKQAKIALIRKHFGDEEMTWTRVEEVLPLIDIRLAYDGMYRELKQKPSQYAGLFTKANTTTDMDDELPGDLGKPHDEDSRPGVEQQLLSEIPKLMSMQDTVHFAGEVAKRDDLTVDMTARINSRLITRQQEIMKLTAPAVQPEQGEAGGDKVEHQSEMAQAAE